MVISTGFAEPKYAMRKLVRGSNGAIQVVFIDAKSGEQIVNPAGYKIIEAGTDVQAPTAQVTQPTQAPQQQVQPSLTEKVADPQTSGGNNQEQSLSDRVASSPAPTQSNRQSLQQSPQNFGYFDKPGIMSFAGALPGPLGLAGKAVNVGINASNMQATSKARDMLNMPSLGFMDNAKGVLSDQKGYVGSIAYSDPTLGTQVTPVGFEALTKQGQTTLTPNEARMRQQLNPTTVEATKQQTKTNLEAFQKEQPPGLFSSMAAGVKDMFSNIFGDDDAMSKDYHPDAPETPDQKASVSYAGEDPDRDQSDGYGGFSGSQQARDAVDSGKGGLW